LKDGQIGSIQPAGRSCSTPLKHTQFIFVNHPSYALIMLLTFYHVFVNKIFLMPVVIAIDQEPPAVVTVYRTSKVYKHWRENE